MSYIPQNLRYLRKLAELSQQALAKKVGLNRGNIASYEKGAAEPNTKNLLKIVRFFNIDVIDFVETDLSQLITNSLLEMSPETESNIFNKRSLTDVILPLHKHKESAETSPLDVLAERSASLFSIIQGISQYYSFIKECEDKTPASMNVEELYMDFMRFLELASEVQDINRQLFRLLIEPQTTSFSRTS